MGANVENNALAWIATRSRLYGQVSRAMMQRTATATVRNRRKNANEVSAFRDNRLKGSND